MSKVPDRKHTDVFAQIASHGAAADRGVLIEPQPPSLPATLLPAGRSNPKAEFRPMARLDTADKLKRELVRQRARHSRFLRNLAPALPSPRLVESLAKFDWRMETEPDLRDFIGTLNGDGKWERVDIPHYGGPVGRATAYYRTTFRVTRAMLAQGALFVRFGGVDYKAHVFMNGAFLGSHEGFFAPFEFEFTPVARIG